jgi:uncharacterized protein (DUF488 family)
MLTVSTFGYKGKSLAAFITRLRDAGVDAVIDVRLRNTSHLAGFTKRDDLAFLLVEGFGIAYEHRPELAPAPEILDRYRADGDWEIYEARFLSLLREREAERVGQELLARYRLPCLLCSEADADHCHRRLVAEHWADHLSGLQIVHL